jgi:hypothetical protein
MSDKRHSYQEFKRFLSKLTPEEIKKGNAKEHAESIRQHSLFVEGFNRNHCYICESPIDSFNEFKPCVHWLLAPRGFRKTHFPLVYKQFTYFNIETYLRWVANLDKPLGNINDLVDEMDSNKFIDHTITYKNLEWSFSCSQSDLQGHSKSVAGVNPHYHFQMRIGGRAFLRFGDYHVPFTDYDLVMLESKKDPEASFHHRITFGEGMEAALTQLSPEEIIENSAPTTDESKGIFRFDTFVEAKPGETISGDHLAELIKESKEKGVPLASLLHKLDAKVSTVVSPGPGVPDIAHRTKRKR